MSKAEVESILKDALSNGKIVSISDNGLTKAGNASYEIVILSDGGMLSVYPIK